MHLLSFQLSEARSLLADAWRQTMRVQLMTSAPPPMLRAQLSLPVGRERLRKTPSLHPALSGIHPPHAPPPAEHAKRPLRHCSSAQTISVRLAAQRSAPGYANP